jgi:hypothetical protein
MKEAIPLRLEVKEERAGERSESQARTFSSGVSHPKEWAKREVQSD